MGLSRKEVVLAKLLELLVRVRGHRVVESVMEEKTSCVARVVPKPVAWLLQRARAMVSSTLSSSAGSAAASPPSSVLVTRTSAKSATSRSSLFAVALLLLLLPSVEALLLRVSLCRTHHPAHFCSGSKGQAATRRNWCRSALADRSMPKMALRRRARFLPPAALTFVDFAGVEHVCV